MTVTDVDAIVVLSLPNGSSAVIYKYGATVTSWKAPAAGTQAPVVERLFLSKKAILDGSKPIRGGIPICFPIFGPPTKPEHKAMSQHGVARSEEWTLSKTVMDSDSGVSVAFELTPNERITAVFPQPFILEYHVTLSVHELTTRLVVHNTSTDTLTYQALLHTYFACDASSVTVSSLKGKRYLDKTKHYAEVVEERDEVDVKEYTDAIYKDAGDSFTLRDVGGGVHIRTHGFKDVVVWNPHAEAGRAIGDMEESGWDKYICVEPGMASYWNEIGPDGSWWGQQVLSTL